MTHEGSLAVWHVDVARVAPALGEIERRCPRLSHDEEARATAVADPREAEAWRTARIALRLLLETVVGADMRRIPFAAGPAGKPQLVKQPGALDFSLSHSGGHVLIGIANPGPVGVDLECLRAVSLAVERRRVLIAAAAAMVPGHSYDVDLTDSELLQAWVRLEALAKARGTGIGLLFRHLGLTGDRCRQGAAAAGQAAADLLRSAGLMVCDIALPAGLFAAVAARSDRPSRIRANAFPLGCAQIAAIKGPAAGPHPLTAVADWCETYEQRSVAQPG
jgi:4'-phosphopantetheinyl transferase